MKIRIFFFLLLAFTKVLVFAQANSPKYGSGLVEFYQNCPIYNDINGEVIGRLKQKKWSSDFILTFNNGDSVLVKEWLEMSCCDSHPELLFYEKKEGFVNIARNSNNDKGVWLRENNAKDSLITSISWQSMILDTINYSNEFYFMPKKESIKLFKTTDSKSRFETLNTKRNWYIKLTGKVKGSLIEIIAVEKKFDPCYEYYSEEHNDKQRDLRTKRGYIQVLEKSGLPIIWFLLCEM